MELLNSITLFEGEYLENKYCICVIIWCVFFPPSEDLIQSSIKTGEILFYMCNILTNALQTLYVRRKQCYKNVFPY